MLSNLQVALQGCCLSGCLVGWVAGGLTAGAAASGEVFLPRTEPPAHAAQLHINPLWRRDARHANRAACSLLPPAHMGHSSSNFWPMHV